MKSLKFFRSLQKKKKKLVLSFSVPKVSALNFGARFSVRSCFSLSRQNTMITLTRCVRNTKIGPRQSEAEEEKGRAFSVNHLFCSRPLDLVKKQPKRFASFFASPEISRIASSALDKVSSRDRERVSIKRKKSHLASHEEKKKKLDKKKAIDPIETKKNSSSGSKGVAFLAGSSGRGGTRAGVVAVSAAATLRRCRLLPSFLSLSASRAGAVAAAAAAASQRSPTPAAARRRRRTTTREGRGAVSTSAATAIAGPVAGQTLTQLLATIIVSII